MSYRKAIEMRASFVDSHYNLGNFLEVKTLAQGIIPINRAFVKEKFEWRENKSRNKIN